MQLILLENVRFYKEEEKNNAEFSQKVGAPQTDSVCCKAITHAHLVHLQSLTLLNA